MLTAVITVAETLAVGLFWKSLTLVVKTNVRDNGVFMALVNLPVNAIKAVSEKIAK